MIYVSKIVMLYITIHVHDRFMIYVSKIVMLYTLNLCSAVCHLYLNKTRRK